MIHLATLNQLVSVEKIFINYHIKETQQVFFYLLILILSEPHVRVREVIE